jgi:intracellular sulfur oxidation DsrE/DsrF family protein
MALIPALLSERRGGEPLETIVIRCPFARWLRRAAVLTLLLPLLAFADPYKVVIQVSDNDPAKWNLALNNARNIQKDLGADNVDVEIVAYGPGIAMLEAESPVAHRIDEAIAAQTKIVACENTMAAQKLGRSDMLPAVGYVPAGVVELIKRQREGWAYLRP